MMNDKIYNKIQSDPINTHLLNLVSNIANTNLYIVGGYLRDIILDIETHDRDYVVEGTSAIEFAKQVAEFYGGHFILLDKDFDIARVVLEDKVTILDFAGCIGNNILEDLNRRDLTINSLTFQLCENNNNLYDPYNGLMDCKNKIVKSISNTNLVDDPLRLLRIFRLAAQLNFKIEQNTLESTLKYCHLIKNVAAERIESELCKLISSKNSFYYLKQMADFGLLDEIFPVLTVTKTVPPNVYHHLCLYDHTLEVYKQVELSIKDIPERACVHLNDLIGPSYSRLTILKYSALLHDIGKPATWKIDSEGKHSFIGHPEVGANMAEILLKDMKLPNNVQNLIVKLIKFHLYPAQVSNNDEMPTLKALLRFFRKLGDEVPEAIILGLADRRSALGPLITLNNLHKHEKMLFGMLDEYYITLDKEIAMPKLIDGHYVMSLLNIKPSEKVGQILKIVRDLQIEGALSTREDARDWILKNFTAI